MTKLEAFALRRVLIFLLTFTAVLIGVGLTLTRNTADRIAYFKSPDNNRVLIYVATPETAADARSILTRAPWTEGRLTTAYLYTPTEAEPARLSLTAEKSSVLDATAAVETAAPSFSCRLTIAPTGSKSWTGDCSDA